MAAARARGGHRRRGRRSHRHGGAGRSWRATSAARPVRSHRRGPGPRLVGLIVWGIIVALLLWLVFLAFLSLLGIDSGR